MTGTADERGHHRHKGPKREREREKEKERGREGKTKDEYIKRNKTDMQRLKSTTSILIAKANTKKQKAVSAALMVIV